VILCNFRPVLTSDAVPRPRKVFLSLAGRRLRFALHFAWDEAMVAGQRTTMRIPQPTLTGHSTRRSLTKSVANLCDRLAAALDRITPLLSLLSRRHVRWSEIRIDSRSREPAFAFSTYRRVRGSRSSHRARDVEALLLPGRMSPDWLTRLASRYLQLPAQESVAAAIVYLIVARDSAFVDAAAANAYTAFEATLNALGDPATAYAMPSAAFDKLARQLRRTVRDFAAQSALPEAAVDSVIGKLPDLRRPPVVGRAVGYLRAHGIETADLWPADVSLDTGLRAIFARRNHFIHAAELGSVHQARVDAERLMILTERMLLRAIGAETAWESPLAFRDPYNLHLVAEPAHD
jgi:hypothetical protein